ncbi:MAG: hypothetical protein NZL91_01285 [Thermoflexales bacterium]|nr:hypothetical protein [Thermoflexales bacterium]MCS7324590.1 hypothetical protein [Thermoflexales bacterium]MDW8053705.1 hypothetical protein [Anaerolineae bacterium]MDW8293393.1 hypothetical protein [Anaerolineae bacterium]
MRGTRVSTVIAALGLGLFGIGLGIATWGVRFDDPFITYRFAENLANGRGFVFNPAGGERVLITTAPLYALLLALPAALGADVPTASNLIGITALIGLALGLFHIGRESEAPAAGFFAGAFALGFPLLWLTVGFETPLFLALATWTLIAAQAGRAFVAGLLNGIAIGLRGDAALVWGLSAVLLFARHRQRARAAALRSALGRLALGTLMAYAPLAIFLTLQFGSPLPTTLQTKTAQAMSGLTGFYPGTTFLQGVEVLVRAYVQLTPLFTVLTLPLAAGIAGLMRHHHALQLGVIGWALLHLLGYALLNVAPYVWYYAPLVPALALTLGVGVAQLRQHRLLVAAAAMLTLAPLLVADVQIARVVRGATPPPPEALASKVLPEAKVDVYERVGRWIAAHTPSAATLGVTELGVMSYYAQRTTFDFLGLTTPSQLGAIRRGDFLASLINTQPDFVALSHVNAIYDQDPQKEDWFRALYRPIAQFADERFWGSPMTVWQRVASPLIPSTMLAEGTFDLGEGWTVTGVAASSRVAQPGAPIIVRVRVRAGAPIGNRTLRVQPIFILRGEGLPVRSRLIHTTRFHRGEEAWYDFPMLVPKTNFPPGAYEISIRWLEGSPEVIAGRVKIPLDAEAPAGVRWLPLSSDVHVNALAGELSACAGKSLTLTLTWRGAALQQDYTVFVHVRDEQGRIVAQHDGMPRGGSYPTTIWSAHEIIPDPHPLVLSPDTVPGSYDVVVGLYDLASGARLPVVNSPARTPDGGVRIGTLKVHPCEG